MLLVMDVGDNNIVFGVFEDDKLLCDWRITAAKDRTSDEYGLLFEQIFGYYGLSPRNVEDVIISSVVSTLIHTLSATSIKYYGKEPIVVGPDMKTRMNIRYDDPKEVGADRIVKAVAGYEKYGGPLIIVDFGSDIIFCAISKTRDYLGDVIVPGTKIPTEALFLRAAKHSKVELFKPSTVIGKNTINSIQSGLIYGYIGLVDFIIEQMMEEMIEEEGRVKTVVATGKFSSLIAKESKYINKTDKLLTLNGLRIVYKNYKHQKTNN